MPTLDANSLLSDPAPIWFDEPGHGLLPDTPQDPLAAALAMVEAQALAQAQRPALSVVPPPPADPLAQALPWLVRHLGVAAAVEAVVGPVDDAQPAASDDVLPALRRIGIDAHLQRRSLSSFGKADLPTILLLHSGDACVLTERWQDDEGQDQCNLVLPGPQPDEFSTAQAEIEAEYSGVALVVSRPARPPLAATLARARAGQLGAGPGSATALTPDDPAAMPHADALVALAAAVQGAQRAMHASRAESNRPDSSLLANAQAMAAANTAAVDNVNKARHLDASTHAVAPASAAARQPALADQADQAAPGAALQDDGPAAVLNLSFLQADKAVVTPGQALARIAHDAKALLHVTVVPLAHKLVAVLRAVAGAGQRGASQAAGLARAGWVGTQGRALALAQGPGQRAHRQLRLLAFRWRQQRLAWRQRQRLRQHHQLAMAALGVASPAEQAPAPVHAQPHPQSHPQTQAQTHAQAQAQAEAHAEAQAEAHAKLPVHGQVHARAQAPVLAAPQAPLHMPTQPLALALDDLAPSLAQHPAPTPMAAAVPTHLTAEAPVLTQAATAPLGQAAVTLPAWAERHPPAPTRPEPGALAPLATRLWPAAVVKTRLATAARWPTLATVAQRLTGAVSRHPLSCLPGLAVASVLCLLVGAPQAWAAMVSDSSRQALQATPLLLRGAFSANLDQAGQALLAEGLARLVAAKNRLDCELGQPALAADPPALASDAASVAAAPPRRGSAARRQADATDAANTAPLARLADRAGPSAARSLVRAAPHAVRGRGVPRRARHVCR